MITVESEAGTVIAANLALPKSKWTKAAMLEAMESAASAAGMAVNCGVCKMRKDEVFARWFSTWPLELPLGQSTGARYRLDTNPAALAEWAHPKPVAPSYVELGTAETEILGKRVTVGACRVDPSGEVYVTFSVIDRSGAVGALRCSHELSVCWRENDCRWFADEVGSSNLYEFEPDEAAELAEALGLPAVIEANREKLGI
ncbi:MAG: hypothetical protein JNG53_05385 [Senegalimassilia sp.]|nr:hypothetical protein [Senegalimassilia sp.]